MGSRQQFCPRREVAGLRFAFCLAADAGELRAVELAVLVGHPSSHYAGEVDRGMALADRSRDDIPELKARVAVRGKTAHQHADLAVVSSLEVRYLVPKADPHRYGSR